MEVYAKCPLEYGTESSRLLRNQPLIWNSMMVLYKGAYANLSGTADSIRLFVEADFVFFNLVEKKEVKL